MIKKQFLPKEDFEYNKYISKLFNDALYQLNARIGNKGKRQCADNNIRKIGLDRNVLISLIGLHKAQCYDIAVEINLTELLKSEQLKVCSNNELGSFGLLLWAAALISPQICRELLSKKEVNKYLNIIDQNIGLQKENLALFLIGLLMSYSLSNNKTIEMIKLIENVFHKILEINNVKENYISEEIVVRNDSISLSEIVFTIHALSLYSKLINDEKPKIFLQESINNLINLQKDSGEWITKNDKTKKSSASNINNKLINHIALVPFGLSMVQKVLRINLSEYISKGIEFAVKSHSWRNESKFSTQSSVSNKNNDIKKVPLKGEKRITTEELSLSDCGWLLYYYSNKKMTNPAKFSNPGKTNKFDIFSIN